MMKRLICFALTLVMLAGFAVPLAYADGVDYIGKLKPALRLDETGFVLDKNSGAVTSWKDSSGNGLLAKPTAMTAPEYKAEGLNGKPTLIFSHSTTGIGLRVDSGALAQGKQYTAFAIYKTELTEQESGVEQFVFRFGGSTHQFALHVGVPAKQSVYKYGASTMALNGNRWGALLTSKAADEAFHISAATYDAEIGKVVTWVDGKSNTASGDTYQYTGAGTGNQLFIGTDQSKTKGLEGEIAAIILYDRVLTDEQIDMVAGQLAGNYGLFWENLTDYAVPGTDTVENHLLAVQETAVTDGTYGVRFLASLDSLEYREVGFRITANFNGKSVVYEIPCSNVYDKILAMDESGTTAEVTAKSFGVNYLAAVSILGIPEDYEVVFRVEPYYIDADGNEIPASVTDITYRGGTFIGAKAAETKEETT